MNKKKILITGGKGFIGSFLVSELKKDYDILILSSTPQLEWQGFPVRSLLHRENLLSETELNSCHAIIHLAGVNIASKRWSMKRKLEIRNSRITPLQQLYRMVHKKTELKTVITASGIGYYDHASATQPLTEESPMGKSFFSQVCRDWENAAFQFKDKNIRTAAVRMGLVLHSSGGFLKPFLLMNSFYLANSIGNPNAWFSWIHIYDVVQIYRFILENETLEGSFNAVSPQPIQQKDFLKTLRVLTKHFTLVPPIPAWIVKLMMGDRAQLVLEGAPVYPKRLLVSGFKFKFPELSAALEDLLSTKQVIEQPSLNRE